MNKKISFLEGIRTFCVCAVMLHHFFFSFFPALITAHNSQTHTVLNTEAFFARSPLNIFYNGNFAFCLLFIVSGFVLSIKFFQTKDEQVVKASAAKRYFRLVIPVLFSEFLGYLFLKFHLFFNLPVSVQTHSFNWLNQFWNFQANFLEMLYEGLVGVFFFGASKYNSVLWMMRYEFLGSFLVLGFLAFFGKLKFRYLLYGLLAFIFMNTYYLGFIVGMFFADLYAADSPLLKKVHPVILLLLFSVGVYFASYPITMSVKGTMYFVLKHPILRSPISFYHTLGGALIMIVVFNVAWIRKFLSAKLFVRFAKLAFSLYLLHQIVIYSLTSYLFLFFRLRLSYLQTVLASGTISFIVLLGAAFLMYQYVEKNGQKLSQFIYKKLFV